MSKEPVLTLEESERLEQYFKAEYPGMLKYARSVTRDREMAEDVVQNTFETATKKIKDFLGSENPVGWLYNTMKHKIEEAGRDKRKHLERDVSLEDVPEQGREMPPLTTVDFNNPDVKLVNRLCEGYRFSDMAEEEGISVAAAKMRVQRAKQRLRKDPVIRELKYFES